MSAISNSKIRVSDLDFTSIKENFKEYLRAQSEFADYDFEASGMSILLDTLAYNTYYNSVLANFTANETFIDSAVKRDSVVSHAKALGYRPKSVKASKAIIQLTLTNAVGNPNQLTMKAGTSFETTVREKTYQFVTLNDIIASNNNNEYVFPDADIYQGQFQQNSFVASGIVAEKFTLPNAGVDSTSIRVVIQTSATVLEYDYYNLADTVVDIVDDSKVFFIQEGLSRKTEIYFGDDIIGKKLSAGNIVYVTYLTSEGQNANDAKVFKLTSTIEGNSVVKIKTIEKSSGGADAEDIDSIKFNAMTYFGVQNRAVTAGDYKSLILQNFTNAKNVITWGGEKQTPPEYGKIFICIQPKNTDFLTDSEKQEIVDIIKKRSVANISSKFVDPEYIDIEVDSTVFYDPLKNDKNTVDLRNNILSVITQYAENYLGKFDEIFRYSQLLRIIDNSDYSIMSNLTQFKVFKSFLPTLFTDNVMSFNFNNKIFDCPVDVSSINSSGFNIESLSEKVYIRDNSQGVLQLIYYDVSGTIKVVNSNCGSVDYETGMVSISPLTITNYDGDEIRLYITPRINDILSKNNSIVRLQPKNVSLKIMSDKTEDR